MMEQLETPRVRIIDNLLQIIIIQRKKANMYNRQNNKRYTSNF